MHSGCNFIGEISMTCQTTLPLVTPTLLKKLYNEAITSIPSNLEQMVNTGYTVWFDSTTCEGIAQKGDLKIQFSLGSENLYMSVNLMTKNGFNSISTVLASLAQKAA
jgi:hypothetical protein